MTVSLPRVNMPITPDIQEVGNKPQKVLFLAQKTPAGSATAGTLQENILDDNSWDTLYGENSMLSAMLRAYKRLNKVTQIDAISLDDAGSAVDAAGTVVFTGPATQSGTITISVGSKVNHKFEVVVADTDTATDIGDALEALVNADTKCPATAANVAGTVTLTAVNGGTVGNGITLSYEGSVSGVTTTLTGFSGGATNPTLTGVFDVVGDRRYQTIVTPSQYGTDVITGFLDPRFNVNNKVLDGVGFQTITDTFANLIVLANAENSQSLTLIPNKIVNSDTLKGSAIAELDYVISSQVAAIRSLRLTEGSSISQYVIAPGAALDQFGGKEIASLPYFNTPYPDLPLIDEGNKFSDVEQQQLTDSGTAFLGNNITNTVVIGGEFATTRKTDAAGNEELTFKFLNSVDTSSVIREFFFNNNKARFAQFRLTEGDLVQGRNIANPAMILSTQKEFFQSLQGVLIQDGEEARRFFVDNLRITSFDVLNRSVSLSMKIPIVGQLAEITAPIAITFSTNN